MRRLAWKLVVASCGAGLGHAQWSASEVTEISANAPVSWFGLSIAVSGSDAIVGGFQVIHVFEVDADTGTWEETAVLTPGGGPITGFGDVIALSGRTALIGLGSDNTGAAKSGSVLVFESDEGTGVWTEVA